MAFAALFLGSQTAKPLVQLINQSKKIAKGDLNSRIIISREDEIGYLGNAFNNMSDELVKTTTSIENLESEITDRKQMEEALQESEAFTRLVMDNLPIGIAVNSVDPTVIFDYMNDNFLKYYRTTREKLADPDSFWEVVYEEPEFRHEIKKRVLDDCASGDLERMYWEDIPISREGEETSFITAKNFPLPEKQLMISVIWDVTERVQAEKEIKKHSERMEVMVEERTQELRDTQERLIRQERLSVLGQLAGGVGHELRNPLGVISNAIYYLQATQIDVDEKTQDYLDLITKEVHSAERIVSDLLDFGRMNVSDQQHIQVADLVSDVLQKIEIPEHIHVEQNIPDDLPAIWADPLQLSQVLTNLVTNACQAMTSSSSVDTPEGGKISVSSANIISESDQEPCVVIQVKDTGTGISPENLEKLFEPLFTTKPRGIGLGLAISQRYIEANGGSIEVESKQGGGSTFSIFFPQGRQQ
jgi:signal transduction histidine kinase/HAMP domain-containing protein